jgi:Ca2+-binding RTX toxin-like protein
MELLFVLPLLLAGLLLDGLTHDDEPEDDPDTGTPGDDTLRGGTGGDRLDGGEGDDLIDGGAGNDTLSGGEAGDATAQTSYADTIHGGAGDDLIRDLGIETSSTVYAGAGNDTVAVEADYAQIFGREGDDFIALTGSDESTVHGGAGNDTILAETYADVFGDAGNDVIVAGSGHVSGGLGDDLVLSDGDGSVLIGADGNDTLIGDGSRQVVDGGAGADEVMGALGAQLTGGAGEDLFVANTMDVGTWGMVGVTDFDPAAETLHILVPDGPAVPVVTTEALGGDTLVLVNGQQAIRLYGVATATVDPADFIVTRL